MARIRKTASLASFLYSRSVASAPTIFDDRSQFAPSSSNRQLRQLNNAILFLLPLGRRSTAGWCRASVFSECPLLFSALPARVRHPHLPLGRRYAIKRTALCAFALNTRLAPLIAMALRSIASFTKRSVSSRIARFDISRFLAFCTIGHTAGRGPRQRLGHYRA